MKSILLIFTLIYSFSVFAGDQVVEAPGLTASQDFKELLKNHRAAEAKNKALLEENLEQCLLDESMAKFIEYIKSVHTSPLLDVSKLENFSYGLMPNQAKGENVVQEFEISVRFKGGTVCNYDNVRFVDVVGKDITETEKMLKKLRNLERQKCFSQLKDSEQPIYLDYGQGGPLPESIFIYFSSNKCRN